MEKINEKVKMKMEGESQEHYMARMEMLAKGEVNVINRPERHIARNHYNQVRRRGKEVMPSELKVGNVYGCCYDIESDGFRINPQWGAVMVDRIDPADGIRFMAWNLDQAFTFTTPTYNRAGLTGIHFFEASPADSALMKTKRSMIFKDAHICSMEVELEMYRSSRLHQFIEYFKRMWK